MYASARTYEFRAVESLLKDQTRRSLAQGRAWPLPLFNPRPLFPGPFVSRSSGANVTRRVCANQQDHCLLMLLRALLFSVLPFSLDQADAHGFVCGDFSRAKWPIVEWALAFSGKQRRFWASSHADQFTGRQISAAVSRVIVKKRESRLCSRRADPA